jgi:purine-binding chemotaxis protein CheW
MTDFIVFSVLKNKYAVKIENIQRIIEVSEVSNIPNSHQFIDGMMSYEDGVIKVLNFRAMTGIQSYQQELKELFAKLKEAHVSWLDALKESVHSGCEFTQTTNPHMCELGKWIDGFTSYDEQIRVVFKELLEYHKQLHNTGAIILELLKTDKDAALKMLNVDIKAIYTRTVGALDMFVKELDLVSNSLQKLLIYDNCETVFAVKVDEIDDIAHVEENIIMKSSEEESASEYLELDGILDLNGVLINVIKTINLPK